MGFPVAHPQPFLLTVVLSEMDLPVVTNALEILGRLSKNILKKCYGRTAWQNQLRIAERNLCHYWTEGLCALFLQNDQSHFLLGNWLCWEQRRREGPPLAEAVCTSPVTPYCTETEDTGKYRLLMSHAVYNQPSRGIAVLAVIALLHALVQHGGG